jgi:hypothetical protein
MTTRQAKHNAKRRLEGAVTISVTFRADEPGAAQWAKLLENHKGPKQAIQFAIASALSNHHALKTLGGFTESVQYKTMMQMKMS